MHEANDRFRLGRIIGGTKFHLGRVFLDLSYPAQAPPEYIRNGLAVLDDSIAIAQQTMTQAEYQSFRRICYPSGMLSAVWKAVKMAWQVQVVQMKEQLGMQIAPGTAEHKLGAALRIMSQRAKSGQTTPTIMTGPGTPPVQLMPGSKDKLSETESRTRPGDDLPWFAPSIGVFISRNPSVSSNSLILTTFVETIKWQRGVATLSPERGEFKVQGMIEVKGDAGSMICQVKAYCDPKTNSVSSVRTMPVDIKMWKQTPSRTKYPD